MNALEIHLKCLGRIRKIFPEKKNNFTGKNRNIRTSNEQKQRQNFNFKDRALPRKLFIHQSLAVHPSKNWQIRWKKLLFFPIFPPKKLPIYWAKKRSNIWQSKTKKKLVTSDLPIQKRVSIYSLATRSPSSSQEFPNLWKKY